MPPAAAVAAALALLRAGKRGEALRQLEAAGALIGGDSGVTCLALAKLTVEHVLVGAAQVEESDGWREERLLRGLHRALRHAVRGVLSHDSLQCLVLAMCIGRACAGRPGIEERRSILAPLRAAYPGPRELVGEQRLMDPQAVAQEDVEEYRWPFECAVWNATGRAQGVRPYGLQAAIQPYAGWWEGMIQLEAVQGMARDRRAGVASHWEAELKGSCSQQALREMEVKAAIPTDVRLVQGVGQGVLPAYVLAPLLCLLASPGPQSSPQQPAAARGGSGPQQVPPLQQQQAMTPAELKAAKARAEKLNRWLVSKVEACGGRSREQQYAALLAQTELPVPLLPVEIDRLEREGALDPREAGRLHRALLLTSKGHKVWYALPEFVGGGAAAAGAGAGQAAGAASSAAANGGNAAKRSVAASAAAAAATGPAGLAGEGLAFAVGALLALPDGEEASSSSGGSGSASAQQQQERQQEAGRRHQAQAQQQQMPGSGGGSGAGGRGTAGRSRSGGSWDDYGGGGSHASDLGLDHTLALMREGQYNVVCFRRLLTRWALDAAPMVTEGMAAVAGLSPELAALGRYMCSYSDAGQCGEAVQPFHLKEEDVWGDADLAREWEAVGCPGIEALGADDMEVLTGELAPEPPACTSAAAVPSSSSASQLAQGIEAAAAAAATPQPPPPSAAAAAAAAEYSLAASFFCKRLSTDASLTQLAAQTQAAAAWTVTQPPTVLPWRDPADVAVHSLTQHVFAQHNAQLHIDALTRPADGAFSTDDLSHFLKGPAAQHEHLVEQQIKAVLLGCLILLARKGSQLARREAGAERQQQGEQQPAAAAAVLAAGAAACGPLAGWSDGQELWGVWKQREDLGPEQLLGAFGKQVKTGTHPGVHLLAALRATPDWGLSPVEDAAALMLCALRRQEAAPAAAGGSGDATTYLMQVRCDLASAVLVGLDLVRGHHRLTPATAAAVVSFTHTSLGLAPRGGGGGGSGGNNRGSSSSAAGGGAGNVAVAGDEHEQEQQQQQEQQEGGSAVSAAELAPQIARLPLARLLQLFAFVGQRVHALFDSPALVAKNMEHMPLTGVLAPAAGGRAVQLHPAALVFMHAAATSQVANQEQLILPPDFRRMTALLASECCGISKTGGGGGGGGDQQEQQEQQGQGRVGTSSGAGRVLLLRNAGSLEARRERWHNDLTAARRAAYTRLVLLRVLTAARVCDGLVRELAAALAAAHVLLQRAGEAAAKAAAAQAEAVAATVGGSAQVAPPPAEVARWLQALAVRMEAVLSHRKEWGGLELAAEAYLRQTRCEHEAQALAGEREKLAAVQALVRKKAEAGRVVEEQRQRLEARLAAVQQELRLLRENFATPEVDGQFARAVIPADHALVPLRVALGRVKDMADRLAHATTHSWSAPPQLAGVIGSLEPVLPALLHNQEVAAHLAHLADAAGDTAFRILGSLVSELCAAPALDPIMDLMLRHLLPPHWEQQQQREEEEARVRSEEARVRSEAAMVALMRDEEHAEEDQAKQERQRAKNKAKKAAKKGSKQQQQQQQEHPPPAASAAAAAAAAAAGQEFTPPPVQRKQQEQQQEGYHRMMQQMQQQDGQQQEQGQQQAEEVPEGDGSGPGTPTAAAAAAAASSARQPFSEAGQQQQEQQRHAERHAPDYEDALGVMGTEEEQEEEEQFFSAAPSPRLPPSPEQQQQLLAAEEPPRRPSGEQQQRQLEHGLQQQQLQQQRQQQQRSQQEQEEGQGPSPLPVMPGSSADSHSNGTGSTDGDFAKAQDSSPAAASSTEQPPSPPPAAAAAAAEDEWHAAPSKRSSKQSKRQQQQQAATGSSSPAHPAVGAAAHAATLPRSPAALSQQQQQQGQQQGQAPVIVKWSGSWQCGCGHLNHPRQHCKDCGALQPCRQYVFEGGCRRSAGTLRCRYPHPAFELPPGPPPPTKFGLMADGLPIINPLPGVLLRHSPAGAAAAAAAAAASPLQRPQTAVAPTAAAPTASAGAAAAAAAVASPARTPPSPPLARQEQQQQQSPGAAPAASSRRRGGSAGHGAATAAAAAAAGNGWAYHGQAAPASPPGSGAGHAQSAPGQQAPADVAPAEQEHDLAALLATLGVGSEAEAQPASGAAAAAAGGAAAGGDWDNNPVAAAGGGGWGQQQGVGGGGAEVESAPPGGMPVWPAIGESAEDAELAAAIQASLADAAAIAAAAGSRRLTRGSASGASRAAAVPRYRPAGAALGAGTAAAGGNGALSGLRNETGEYNCFLNAIIQCLWRCADFRQQVSEWDGAFCAADRVLSALHRLFSRFQQQEQQRRSSSSGGSSGGSSLAPVDPSALREALAALPSQQFRVGEMNDAAEVLLSVYERVMEVSGGLGRASQLNATFGLAVREEVHCARCGKTTHQSSYTQYFYNTQATVLRVLSLGYPGATTGGLLRHAEEQHEKSCDTDMAGCGAPNAVNHFLGRPPRVFTLQLAWESLHEEPGDIAAALAAIDEQVDLGEVYQGVDAGVHRYRLRSMVCYYGQHYQALVLVPDAGGWLMFDDMRVSRVGAWAAVRRKCEAGRIQPSVLFYEAAT